MNEIQKQGLITTVKGVAIGNGCWGTVAGTNCGDVGGHPGTVYKIDAEYYAGRGLISPELKAAADAACGKEWADPLPPKCKAAWADISIALGPFNIDNVDDFCPQRRGAGLRTLAEHRALQLQQRTKHPVSPAAVGNGTDQVATAVSKAGGDEPPNGGVQMWCGAEDYLGVWRDMPAVLAAMHVEASADHDAFDYTIEPQDLSPTYRKLASDPSLRFVIYNGQSDANVPWNGQCQYWATPDQGWYPLAAPEGWQPWYRAGPAAPAAGHVRTYIHTRGSPNVGTLDRTFKFGARHASPQEPFDQVPCG